METGKKQSRAAREDSTQPPAGEEGGELLPPPPKKGCLTRIVEHPERPPIVSHRHTWTSDALGEGRSLVTTLSNRGLGFSPAIATLKKKQVRFPRFFLWSTPQKKLAFRRPSGPSTGRTKSPASSPTLEKSPQGTRNCSRSIFLQTRGTFLIKFFFEFFFFFSKKRFRSTRRRLLFRCRLHRLFF